MTTDQYKKIKAMGSRLGILYGLYKVHKVIIDVCLPFTPILLAIGTPSYKLHACHPNMSFSFEQEVNG